VLHANWRWLRCCHLLFHAYDFCYFVPCKVVKDQAWASFDNCKPTPIKNCFQSHRRNFADNTGAGKFIMGIRNFNLRRSQILVFNFVCLYTTQIIV
jgi:hypothetical protein